LFAHEVFSLKSELTMSDPSLLNVPYRFKAGTLYSQIPDSGLGDFVVSRTTTPTADLATRINAQGLIETVADNVPRLDYPIGGIANGCPSLLVESSSENLALHSRDLTNIVWVATNITPVKNAVGADGVASGATTLTATAGNATILQSLTHLSQIRVFSAYVRRVTGTGTIEMTTDGGTTWTAVTITSSYTQVGCPPQTLANGAVGFRIVTSGDVIVVDFCQAERTSIKSPIPTTTLAVTRQADIITKTNIASLIGQTEGVFYLNLSYKRGGNSSTSPTRWIDLFGSSDSIGLGLNNFNLIRSVVNGNSDTLSGTDTTTSFKIAWGYDASGVVCFVNGTQYTLTNGGAQVMTSLDGFKIDMTSTSGVRLVGTRILASALFPTRLTNAQLQALTT